MPAIHVEANKTESPTNKHLVFFYYTLLPRLGFVDSSVDIALARKKGDRKAG
jgi:hypothetical protein